MQTSVLALLAGKAAAFANGERSAIAKAPLMGRVRIGFLGVEGDQQADLSVHGGPDKALTIIHLIIMRAGQQRRSITIC